MEEKTLSELLEESQVVLSDIDYTISKAKEAKNIFTQINSYCYTEIEKLRNEPDSPEKKEKITAYNKLISGYNSLIANMNNIINNFVGGQKNIGNTSNAIKRAIRINSADFF